MQLGEKEQVVATAGGWNMCAELVSGLCQPGFSDPAFQAFTVPLGQ